MTHKYIVVVFFDTEWPALHTMRPGLWHFLQQYFNAIILSADFHLFLQQLFQVYTD